MESLNRIVIKKHEINRAFCLNLILSGWLLIRDTSMNDEFDKAIMS